MMAEKCEMRMFGDQYGADRYGGQTSTLRARSAGFTLLEVILASALSLLLLAALYAALKLHLTYSQKAPERVRRSQQARAILARIARDVRAVVPPAPANPPGSGNTPSPSTTNPSATTTTTASTSSSETTSSDAYSDAYGVLGGTDWMQLYITTSRPNLDDAEQAVLAGSVAQASSLVRVTYALTVLNGSPDSQGRTQRLALARSEVASIGAERMDSSSDDADLHATTEYLGDGLAHVQFEYWDDTLVSWVESWGTDVPIAPPRAIKVILSLEPPEEFVRTQLGMGGSSTWEPYYELVIPISTWTSESATQETTGT